MNPLNREVCLHVAPNGSDQNAGAAEHPLATLRGAQNRLRQLRMTHRLNLGATVIIHGGVYAFDQPLVLTAEDSGDSATHPLVFRVAPGEVARLWGGKRVETWCPVSDSDIRNRLASVARDHIVEADLHTIGVQPAPIVSRGFGRKTPPAHNELFFAHLPMTLARWPNADETSEGIDLPGWRRIASFPGDGSNDGHGQLLGTLDRGFFYDGDRPKTWAPSDDIWIHGYWAYDWANSYERIAEIDKGQRLIKTVAPHGLYGFAKGQKFYFLNVLEELDAPGEYFIDQHRGKIYFYPPSPIVGAEVVLSTLGEPLIQMQDASHIQFQGPGLSIEYTRSHGVTITGGENCLIAGVALKNIGSYGVRILGGLHHGVTSCEVASTGDGGVGVQGGERESLTPSRHFVENCHFHHQARWSRCYHPAVLIQGVGSHVSNNVIHDHPHCPVLFTGNDHLIEKNEIYSACWETGDVGGIYMGRDYTERGNVISHNYLHHLGGIGLGSFAVYLDDCASGTRVENNVFHRTNMAVLIGGGRDNTVENNLVVDSVIGVHLDGRGVSPAQVWHNMVYQIMKERFDKMNPLQPPYSIRYPELAKLPAFFADKKGVPADNTRLIKNVCVGARWLVIAWHANAEWVYEESNERCDAQVFLNPDHPELEQFRYVSGSDALRSGHQPIAVDRIGFFPNEYRPNWPHVISAMDWFPDEAVVGQLPTGTLRVTLVNRGSSVWRGIARAHIVPWEAAEVDRPAFEAEVPPGAKFEFSTRMTCAQHHAEVDLQCEDPRTPGLRPSRKTMRFPLAIPRASTTCDLEQVSDSLSALPWLPISAGGARLGDVRFALLGDCLALDATILDTDVQRNDSQPWTKSCVEVFGAEQQAESADIGQVYLLPTVRAADACGSVEAAGSREPSTSIRVTSTTQADGYNLSALIPLNLLKITPGSHEFFLEMVVNSSATPGAGAKRSSLFGSSSPYRDSTHFARVMVK